MQNFRALKQPHPLTIKTPHGCPMIPEGNRGVKHYQAATHPRRKNLPPISRNQSAGHGSNIVQTMTLPRLAIEKR